MLYTECKIGNTVFYLLYNGYAFFDVMEKVGENPQKAILKANKEGFSALCTVFSTLAVCGELSRRQEGYDKGLLLTEDRCKMLLSIRDIPAVRSACMEAMINGFKTESDPDEIVDEVLMEIEKKTSD